ncbi:MAG: hypothetical protein ACKO4L_04490 [Nodosilinea sp.]
MQGDPYGFVQQLPQMGARLISLQQARPSQEEFFMTQVGRQGNLGELGSTASPRLANR